MQPDPSCRTEKERESRSYGRAHIGGPFVLDAVTPDTNGKANPAPFADTDMLGKWNLVYFGFTNCPDICPAEMDKMGEVLNQLGITSFLSCFDKLAEQTNRKGLW